MTRVLLLAGFSALFLGGFCSWLSAAPSSIAPVPEQMTAARMAELQKVIRPCEGEDAFDKIAWLTAIHDARVQAAKTGKPILLWEMDGHPLGCG